MFDFEQKLIELLIKTMPLNSLSARQVDQWLRLKALIWIHEELAGIFVRDKADDVNGRIYSSGYSFVEFFDKKLNLSRYLWP